MELFRIFANTIYSHADTSVSRRDGLEESTFIFL